MKSGNVSLIAASVADSTELLNSGLKLQSEADRLGLTGYPRFLSMLGQFHPAPEAHLFFSFLIEGDCETFNELISKSQLKATIVGKWALFSGSLEQWKSTALVCCTIDSKSRITFNNIIEIFEAIGIRFKGKEPVKDGTFFLK